MKAEDLLAAVFPDAIACQDNLTGERAMRQIPDHPLVQETLRDCLTEAMDLDGLTHVLRRIESGSITCVAVDSPAPSVLSSRDLERKSLRLPGRCAAGRTAGSGGRAAARRCRLTCSERSVRSIRQRSTKSPAESWPVVRDADELHDALLTLVWVPESTIQQWQLYLPLLIVESGRAVLLTPDSSPFMSRPVNGWVATENKDRLEQLSTTGDNSTFDALVLGWMESIGPTTIDELATRLHLFIELVDHAMLRLETSGQVLRGRFRPSSAPPDASTPEWCHRRLLARIHRLTIGILRKEVEPVTATEFMRFLMQWQHVTPGSRQHGEAGLLQVIGQLAGFEAAASAWEPQLLRSRMARYEPEFLDRLCLSGAVSWGRLSPHPKFSQAGEMERRRIVPTSLAPISLFLREDREWLMNIVRSEGTTSPTDPYSQLSVIAQDLCRALQQQGASFFADLARMSRSSSDRDRERTVGIGGGRSGDGRWIR